MPPEHHLPGVEIRILYPFEHGGRSIHVAERGVGAGQFGLAGQVVAEAAGDEPPVDPREGAGGWARTQQRRPLVLRRGTTRKGIEGRRRRRAGDEALAQRRG